MKYARCNYLISLIFENMWLQIDASGTSWPTFPLLPRPEPTASWIISGVSATAAVPADLQPQKEEGSD